MSIDVYITAASAAAHELDDFELVRRQRTGVSGQCAVHDPPIEFHSNARGIQIEHFEQLQNGLARQASSGSRR